MAAEETVTARRGCEPRGARASAGRQFPGARRLMTTGSDDGPLAHGRPLTELESTTSSAGRSRARLKTPQWTSCGTSAIAATVCCSCNS